MISNSLEIDFNHGDTHGRSCKKLLFFCRVLKVYHNNTNVDICTLTLTEILNEWLVLINFPNIKKLQLNDREIVVSIMSAIAKSHCSYLSLYYEHNCNGSM